MQLEIKRVLLAVAQRSSQHRCMLIEYGNRKHSDWKKMKMMKNNGHPKRAIAGYKYTMYP